MNKLLVTTLTPSTFLSEDAFLDDKFILLSPDTPITEGLINRLRHWNFGYLLTAGHPLESAVREGDGSAGEAPLSGLIEIDVKEQEYIKEAVSLFTDLLDFTERMFTDFVTKNDLSIRAISDTIKDLLEAVRNRRAYILRFSHFPESDKNYIVGHTVKTTILSVAIGQALKLPPHRLIELGASALVHEIGMIRLPPQLYMANRELSAQEKRAIAAHTVYGFKELRRLSFPMPVCMAVLEHHEHLDGTGYPRNLVGDKISEAARIIAVADAYAALISDRPHRAGRDGHTGIMDLLKDRFKRYDERVVRALISCISIFPIGSFVLLTSGSKAVVVDVNPENVKAPVVKVLAGPSGERFKDPIVVKAVDKDNQIVRTLAPEEVGALH